MDDVLKGLFEFNKGRVLTWLGSIGGNRGRVLSQVLSHRLLLRLAPLAVVGGAPTPTMLATDLRNLVFAVSVSRFMAFADTYELLIGEEERKACRQFGKQQFESKRGLGSLPYLVMQTYWDPNSLEGILQETDRIVAKLAIASSSNYFFNAFANTDERTRARMKAQQQRNQTAKLHSIWRAFESDYLTLREDADVRQLREKPLWNSATNPLAKEYSLFNDALASGDLLDDQWDIWRAWFAGVQKGTRLFGLKNDKDIGNLLRRIALGSANGEFDKGFWFRRNHDINADIAQWVEEFRNPRREEAFGHGGVNEEASVTPPHLNTTQFMQGQDGKITVIADPLAPAFGREFADLEDLYEDARLKALSLSKLGRNMLGSCFEPVEQLLSHTPEEFTLARVNRIHAKLTTLRDRVYLHELQMAKPLKDRDIALVLQEEVAVTLSSCVKQFNLLMAFDKRGRELNNLQHGPEARKRADETNVAVQPVVLNIGDIAEGATVNIVQGDNNNILNAPRNIHGDQAAVRTAQQNENLMMSILQVGWRIAKETERQGLSEPTVQLAIAVGGQHGVQILEFIQKYDQAFMWLAQHVEAFQILGPFVLMLFAYAKILGKADK